jgi:hypothetical protein
MNFLAVGPHCWGKGKTREEAVKNARYNFPAAHYRSIKRVMDKHFSIYTSEGEFAVDGMGNITSTKDDINKLQKSILAE